MTAPGRADTLRFATFNTELSRKGPGLLLRDILAAKDAQVNAVLAQIIAADADVIALQGLIMIWKTSPLPPCPMR